MRNCTECMAGEHDNYSEIVGTFKVWDEDGNFLGFMILCDWHTEALTEDQHRLVRVGN